MKSNFLICPTCKRPFYPTNKSVTANIFLKPDNITNNYIYCSNDCFESKLKNVGKIVKNGFILRLLSKELISESPIQWKIICRAERKILYE